VDETRLKTCDRAEAFLKNLPGTKGIGLTSALVALSSAELADAFNRLEEQGQRVDLILMSDDHFRDLRRVSPDILTLEKPTETKERGLKAFVWGAAVFVHWDVPARWSYLIGEVPTGSKESPACSAINTR